VYTPCDQNSESYNGQRIRTVVTVAGFFSIKSPATGAVKVSEPTLMSQSWRVRKSCARRSACFCSRSGRGVSIGLLT